MTKVALVIGPGLDLLDVEYVCLHLRAADAREVFGVRHDDNPMSLAMETVEVVHAHGFGRVFYREGRPAAVCGAAERHPGVWVAFAYGTDEFGLVAGAVSRYALGELRSALMLAGAHRLEAQSRSDHVRAHAWLEWLGASRESVLVGYGSDGADYFNFVWTGDRADVFHTGSAEGA